MIKIAQVNHLDNIIKLWQKNRATLGLMPQNAFRECIKKRWILVSCNESDDVVAYLQFRFTNRTQTISIVHLCVAEELRGNNIAKELLDELIKLYQNKVVGIKLSCRSDYIEAIKFWQKYNFQPKHKRASRGSDPNIELITWWYSFGKIDLFSSLVSDKITAVLDFNIISKLRDNDLNSTNFNEVEVLNTGWVLEEVDFIITSETVSEIFRDTDRTRNEQSRSYIKSFSELNLNKGEINRVEKTLIQLFPGKSENAISDRRQLAETILSETPYFITLDDEILKKADLLNEQFGLKVFTPNNFVRELDELKNSINYHPAQLSAENFSINRLSTKDYGKLNCFIYTPKENRKDLDNKVNHIHNRNGELLVIKNRDEMISLVGHYIDGNFLVVDLLRLIKHPLTVTVLIQNIFDIINYASSKAVPYISLSDHCLQQFDRSVFEQFGFFFINNSYLKSASNKILNIEDTSKFFDEVCTRIPSLRDLTTQNMSISIAPNLWQLYFLEKKLWPLKINCDLIPTYIVPIKP